jgi:hypothetical protein
MLHVICEQQDWWTQNHNTAHSDRGCYDLKPATDDTRTTFFFPSSIDRKQQLLCFIKAKRLKSRAEIKSTSKPN